MKDSQPSGQTFRSDWCDQPEESALDPVDPESFIRTVVWLGDEAIPLALNGQPLRQRGPAPLLADREVVTLEVVGEYRHRLRPAPCAWRHQARLGARSLASESPTAAEGAAAYAGRPAPR